MTVEELLREAVAPRPGTDPAVEERARLEAMAALDAMRRRHRVRRAISVAGAAAGVAAIAGLFVFGMPRGGDHLDSSAGTTTGPRPAVALLTRPERPVDRFPGDIARYGAGPAPVDVRFAGSGERLRFYAARIRTPDRLCVLATTRSGGVPRGAACNAPSVLAHVGVLTFERGRNQTGRDGRAVADRAFLVPDGIRRVVVDGRTLAVRDNLATAVGTLGTGSTLTLVGPGARGIRPEGGADWPRGSAAGMPTVEVPLSAGSVGSARPTPLGAVRIAVPRSAPAGSVIDLRVVGPDGLLGDNIVYGTDTVLEARRGVDWRPVYGLNIGSVEEGAASPAVALGPGGAMASTAIGLTGGGPRPVRLPDARPGTYRISKRISEISGAAPAERTVSAEIRITAR